MTPIQGISAPVQFTARRRQPTLAQLERRVERLETELTSVKADIAVLRGKETPPAPPSTPSGTVKFLSPEWAAAVEAGLKNAQSQGRTFLPSQFNIIVIPKDKTALPLHVSYQLDSNNIRVSTKPIDDPEMTVTMDYATLQAVSEGNAQAIMQAFMSGKMKVQGDMTKIMALQQASVNFIQPTNYMDGVKVEY